MLLQRQKLPFQRHTRRRSLMVTAHAAAKLESVRNLHWVFKVADRTATVRFYEGLGMTTLRHEEFEEGCAAACNGPYDGRWSKTMIGYGDEDTQFVLELTYNYGVKEYELGNDYRHITIRSARAFNSLKSQSQGQLVKLPDGTEALEVAAPGGYKFLVANADTQGTVMTELCLSSSNVEKSVAFWSGFLGFQLLSSSPSEALLSCGPGQAQLRLVALPPGTPLNRGTAFGRVAFSTPGHLLQQLETDVKAAGYTVHTPYVSLDTPGKATVQVVILQDPDGHEICFVGDEGFRDLSRVDPQAPKLLAEAIAADKSVEWMEKRAKMEAAMAAKGV